MPMRGLRDTAPYHWDGSWGPHGGNNTANINTQLAPPVPKGLRSIARVSWWMQPSLARCAALNPARQGQVALRES